MTKTTTRIVETTVALAATRINRHWNDDGSLTLYAGGRKLIRIGGEENDDATEAQVEDPEGWAERWLSRRHKKATGGWVWGRATAGHNWHTKKAKIERLRAEASALAAERGA